MTTAMDHDPENRLSNEKIAIVGVGGTGSHILDYISKIPVAEIQIFDGDCFLRRNARRSPGPVAEITEPPTNKALFHGSRYAMLDNGPNIEAYDTDIHEDNVEQLSDRTTVFLSMSGGSIKRRILQVCEENQIILINVGMGVLKVKEERLDGMACLTSCIPSAYDHACRCFSLGEPSEIDHNYQTIELNALNAALAVIKWKKLLGIYVDDSRELDCTYSIAKNEIYNTP